MSKEQKAAIAGLIILFTLSVGLFLGSLGTNTTEHADAIYEQELSDLYIVSEKGDEAKKRIEVIEDFQATRSSR